MYVIRYQVIYHTDENTRVCPVLLRRLNQQTTAYEVKNQNINYNQLHFWFVFC